MNPTPEETYERSRRLASGLARTVALQCRRIRSSEPEDEQFLLRRWADYEFHINALSRLRRIAVLASKVSSIKAEIEEALGEFDNLLPGLVTMRNTLEHEDEYAIDLGRDSAISRKELEVGTFGEENLEWIGFTLKIEDAKRATDLLFKAITNALEPLQGRI